MPTVLVPSLPERIAAQILVIAKLTGRKYFILRGFVCDIIRPSKGLPSLKLATEAQEQDLETVQD